MTPWRHNNVGTVKKGKTANFDDFLTSHTCALCAGNSTHKWVLTSLAQKHTKVALFCTMQMTQFFWLSLKLIKSKKAHSSLYDFALVSRRALWSYGCTQSRVAAKIDIWHERHEFLAHEWPCYNNQINTMVKKRLKYLLLSTLHTLFDSCLFSHDYIPSPLLPVECSHTPETCQHELSYHDMQLCHCASSRCSPLCPSLCLQFQIVHRPFFNNSKDWWEKKAGGGKLM